MPQEITIEKTHTGHITITLSDLEAEELYRTYRRMHCGDHPDAFPARYRVAIALEQLALILRPK